MFPTIRCQNQFPNEFEQPESLCVCTLQIYTAGNGTHVKNVKVTSICRRYYNVEV